MEFTIERLAVKLYIIYTIDIVFPNMFMQRLVQQTI